MRPSARCSSLSQACVCVCVCVCALWSGSQAMTLAYPWSVCQPASQTSSRQKALVLVWLRVLMRTHFLSLCLSLSLSVSLCLSLPLSVSLYLSLSLYLSIHSLLWNSIWYQNASGFCLSFSSTHLFSDVIYLISPFPVFFGFFISSPFWGWGEGVG